MAILNYSVISPLHLREYLRLFKVLTNHHAWISFCICMFSAINCNCPCYYCSVSNFEDKMFRLMTRIRDLNAQTVSHLWKAPETLRFPLCSRLHMHLQAPGKELANKFWLLIGCAKMVIKLHSYPPDNERAVQTLLRTGQEFRSKVNPCFQNWRES